MWFYSTGGGDFTLCLWGVSECLLDWNFTDWVTASVFSSNPLSHAGLISPGVSVPVQVPGTEQQSMSHNLGQYWARLQWTDNGCQQKKKNKKKGHVTKKVSRKQYGVTRVFKEAQDWDIERASTSCRPWNALNVYKFRQEQLWLHLTVLWSYWYLLSIIKLHFFVWIVC